MNSKLENEIKKNNNKKKFVLNKATIYKLKKSIILLIIIYYLVTRHIFMIKTSRVLYLYTFRSHYSKYVILKEKKLLLKHISYKLNKNITHIDSIFLDFSGRFGNQLVVLNKAIFYCEILHCKQIIINKVYNWFIKNKIIHTYNNNFTMIIEPGDKKDYKNNSNVLIDNSENFFFYNEYIRPQYRMEVIKKEVLMNLPRTKVNSEDLYIYIRSGDIFDNLITGYYQPPFCFYKAVLDNFKFENIYIISENKKNPNIDKLFALYPNIIFQNNSLKHDISILTQAYNVVGGFTTFLKVIMLLNDNLKKFWIFHFIMFQSFSYFFTYEFNHKNITIFRMPTYNYYSKVKECNDLQSQINYMMNYTCKNGFVTINYIFNILFYVFLKI